MNDSAIERLKNRERKKVAARNASLNQTSQVTNESNNINLLTETSQVINESNNIDLLTETSQVTNESNNIDLLTEASQVTNESNNIDLLTETSQVTNELNNIDLLTEASQVINESNNIDLLTETSQSILSKDTEPVRRTIRLDPTVDAYMDTLCKNNKITKETLFEAAIIVCSKNQKTLNKAIADAQKRYNNRKRIGEMKKLETMNRKFKNYSG
jgi:hypothetical protein